MEEIIYSITDYLRLITETISIIIVITGVGVTVYNIIVRTFLMDNGDYFNEIRVIFSRYLVLGLEFLLASDLLGTAIKSSWSQIGQVAVIALIRTFLNYFLLREAKEEKTTRLSKRDKLIKIL